MQRKQPKNTSYANRLISHASLQAENAALKKLLEEVVSGSNVAQERVADLRARYTHLLTVRTTLHQASENGMLPGRNACCRPACPCCCTPPCAVPPLSTCSPIRRLAGPDCWMQSLQLVILEGRVLLCKAGTAAKIQAGTGERRTFAHTAVRC